MDCLFCKIVSGEVQSIKIYEDNDIIAILDIFPANPGHILIFPKTHLQRLEEIPDELIGKMFVLAKYLSNNLIKNIGADGINIYLASGEVAGQRSPHILLHVIPRFKDDNINFEWERKKVDPNNLLQIAEKIKLTLQGMENPPVSHQTPSQQKLQEDKKNKDNNKNIYSKMYEWFKRRNV